MEPMLVIHNIKPHLHDRTDCQTGWTTGWMFVYTMQPIVQLVWQQVVLCKRGFNLSDAVSQWPI